MVTIPTINQLYNDILNDLQSQYDFTIPVFGKIFIRALAAVQASKHKLLYLGIAITQKNTWPDTADSITNGGTLERSGLIKIGRNPFPAVSAQYTIRVTGLAGAVIPGYGKTQFTSDANSLNPNMLFTLDNPYTCTGSNDFITIRALTPGTISQLNIGDTLTATAPITNVTQTGGNTVTAQVVQPLDAETIEAYREIVLYSFQSQPNGGNSTSYRIWAGAIDGVANVYPFAVSGQSNQVNLYVESDIADSTDGKGTPSGTVPYTEGDGSMITAIADYIEGNGPNTLKRPLGIFLVNYLPVIPYNVTVSISSSNPAFTTSQQQQIADVVSAWVNTVRPFVAGADILANKNDIINLNFLILQILTAAPGTSFGTVSFTVKGTSFSTYQFLNGYIPFMTGTFVFTSGTLTIS